MHLLKPFFLLIICLLAGLFSCKAFQANERILSDTTKNEKGVEAALKLYDRLILKLDADSIALLYAPDGIMGTVAIGRDSIRNFLRALNVTKILSQNTVSESIQIINDTAFQKGIYTQEYLMPKGHPIKGKGEIWITWLWIKNEGWRISKMITKLD